MHADIHEDGYISAEELRGVQRSAAQARHIESFFTPGYLQHLHAHPSYSGSRGDGSCNSSERQRLG